MKLSLPRNLKSYTGFEVDAMREVIESMKEDSSTVSDYAAAAIREAIRPEGGYIVEIFKATATIEGNGRIENAFSPCSLSFDVWIEATAETSFGFVKIGAYLTDIWNIDGENAAPMYKRLYHEDKTTIKL